MFASGLHIFYECFARVKWWVSGSAWLLIFCAGSSVCVSGAARMEMERLRMGMLGCLRVDYIYFMSVLRVSNGGYGSAIGDSGRDEEHGGRR